MNRLRVLSGAAVREEVNGFGFAASTYSHATWMNVL